MYTTVVIVFSIFNSFRRQYILATSIRRSETSDKNNAHITEYFSYTEYTVDIVELPNDYINFGT